MSVLRGDPWDVSIQTDTATLQDLIAANCRVIVNVGKGRSDSPLYWGDDDTVCNGGYYPDSLGIDWTAFDYDWVSAVGYIDTHMRAPCTQGPQVINKLEFEFHTALGGTIDTNHVGQALARYMDGLHARNGNKTRPFFPVQLDLDRPLGQVEVNLANYMFTLQYTSAAMEYGM
ncbi:Aste57867_9125 [Aphanomyces stellatus]|uniref:Aste57867_9125 protein n=1 Tax=Aphanomyces stellatus TaxID=120398 RepID=A0A485KM24_9STRA|nr:hypothetical protein As57867_009089 [Aphanomyces stellatus]VFT86009.1 Aste57867_9125 [Aphanomyces stellatus]